MRTGISINLKPADRRRLKALARDRNSPHKHIWRAEIVLLSADGVGTNEIMRRTGKSKTCVWRWQERFMQAGYDKRHGTTTLFAALNVLDTPMKTEKQHPPRIILARSPLDPGEPVKNPYSMTFSGAC